MDGEWTHLIQFVAEVYRVDIVAFKVGEHDDLDATNQIREAVEYCMKTYEEDHGEQETSGHEHREEE